MHLLFFIEVVNCFLFFTFLGIGFFTPCVQKHVVFVTQLLQLPDLQNSPRIVPVTNSYFFFIEQKKTKNF
jgi:hypothetical protein